MERQAGAPEGEASEGPIEVVLSRVLSALGYHQPPVYYLPDVHAGGRLGRARRAGRTLPAQGQALKDSGEWSWQQNPFVGTRAVSGAAGHPDDVQQLRPEELQQHALRAPRRRGVEQWYVVRDLGTALGDTGRLAPERGDPDVVRARAVHHRTSAMASSSSIIAAGIRSSCATGSRPTDVAWASDCSRASSDRQWDDAFRAGGFAPEPARRASSTRCRPNRAGRSSSRQPTHDRLTERRLRPCAERIVALSRRARRRRVLDGVAAQDATARRADS